MYNFIFPLFAGLFDIPKVVLYSMEHGARTFHNRIALFMYVFLLGYKAFLDYVGVGNIVTYLWLYPSSALCIFMTEWLISKNTTCFQVISNKKSYTPWSQKLAHLVVHKCTLPLIMIFISGFLIIPFIGYILYVISFALVYSIYVFDAAWTVLDVSLQKRRTLINKNIVYLLSFGIPFSALLHVCDNYNGAISTLALYHYAIVGVCVLKTYPPQKYSHREIKIFWFCRQFILSAFEIIRHCCRN